MAIASVTVYWSYTNTEAPSVRWILLQNLQGGISTLGANPFLDVLFLESKPRKLFAVFFYPKFADFNKSVTILVETTGYGV